MIFNSRSKHMHIVLILVAAIMLLVIGCVQPPAQPAGQPAQEAPEEQAETPAGEATIGFANPFSRAEGFLGPAIQSGIDLAIDQINAAGGAAGQKVKLITGDTEARAESSVAVIDKFLNVDNVDAIIGPTSLTVFAVLDTIKESKVPTMVIGGTSRLDTTMGGETVWRPTPSDSLMGPVMVKIGLDISDRAGVLFEDQESAQSVKDNVVPVYEAAGGTIVGDVDVAPLQSAYRTEATKLFENDPPVVFFQLAPETAGPFFKNAQELGLLEGRTFIGTDVILSEDFVNAVGPYAEGVTFLAASPTAAGPGKDEFVSAYQEKYGEEPRILSDKGYDAMNILALAIEAGGGTDAATIADHVRAVANPPGEECTNFSACADLLQAGEEINYEGAGGSQDFDEQGNVLGTFGVFEIVEGEFVQQRLVTEDELRSVVSE